jgi:hypothetical protein
MDYIKKNITMSINLIFWAKINFIDLAQDAAYVNEDMNL